MHEAQKLAAAVVSTLRKEGGFGRDCVHNSPHNQPRLTQVYREILPSSDVCPVLCPSLNVKRNEH